MLSIEFAIDPPAPDELTPADIRTNLVDAVNELAEGARLHVVEALPQVFDRPTRFTKRVIGLLKARTGRRDVEAIVNILPQQAKYLTYEVFGGVRRAGDYATAIAVENGREVENLAHRITHNVSHVPGWHRLMKRGRQKPTLIDIP